MCARVVRSILPIDLGFSCAIEPNSGLPRGKKSIYESKKRPKCDSTQVNPIQEVLRGYLASLFFYPLSVAIYHCPSVATITHSLECLSLGAKGEKSKNWGK